MSVLVKTKRTQKLGLSLLWGMTEMSLGDTAAPAVPGTGWTPR